jgi:hypothetical protein
MRSAFIAAGAVILVMVTTSCGGVDVVAKIADEAAAASAAADVAKSALDSGQIASAESHAQSAVTDSEEAIDAASTASISTQTKDTVGTARSEALATEADVHVQTVPVNESPYTDTVRSTVQAAICTVVDNALSGQQQPDVQEWQQEIDNTVQANLQAAAGGAVPQIVVAAAIVAVHQYVDPWVQKYNDLVNFDPRDAQSFIQTAYDYMNC